MADLIDLLVEKHKLDLNTLIVVGHSLGAHIVGMAGKNIKSGRLPIIIGLDPAYPLFTKKNTAVRLTFSDADYVQIIHTGTQRLSISYPIGHADFYPNWGDKQPGCKGQLKGFLQFYSIALIIALI